MESRATVIVPTFGNAKFARWAIKSVQNQTIKDIEICIICDGSPENMVSFFQNMEKEDNRIKVYPFPKSPRMAEPYIDTAIKQTKGKIICYCGHDDLLLPNHVQVMEKTLQKCYFTHSIWANMNLPEYIKDEKNLFHDVVWITLDREFMKRMLAGEGGFGLPHIAHTRKSYNELKEGWVTTPKGKPTDLYMVRKFLAAFGKHCKTTKEVTALKFDQNPRKDWTEQQRDEELRRYYKKINDPIFLTRLHENAVQKGEWRGGFSTLEGNTGNNWRWCSAQGTLILNNPSNKGRRFIISTTFITGYLEYSSLQIRSTLVNEKLRVNNAGYEYRKEIFIPSGRHIIKFSCDAKRLHAPTDPRYIVFGTRNFQMAEIE